MKYYYREHLLGYERVVAEGKAAWAEIQGDHGEGFDNFCSRGFLESALAKLSFSVDNPTVLEYGTGTGPAACFLAERGFQVDAMDLIPAAIKLAKELAKERGLEIHYEVGDICELSGEDKQYDMIVDSFCLQCIVTEADRNRVLSAVRARLKQDGYYLVSTAMFDENRFVEEERIVDTATGVVYNGYGCDIIESQSSIVYRLLDDGPDDYEQAIEVNGRWYLPNRRHLKAPALKAELEASGFRVLYQDRELGGNLICVLGGG